jgi:hypothetical protein
MVREAARHRYSAMRSRFYLRFHLSSMFLRQHPVGHESKHFFLRNDSPLQPGDAPTERAGNESSLASIPPEAMSPLVWPKGRKGTVSERLRRLGEAVWEGRGDVVRSALGAAEFNAMGPTRIKERLLELFAPEEQPRVQCCRCFTQRRRHNGSNQSFGEKPTRSGRHRGGGQWSRHG